MKLKNFFKKEKKKKIKNIKIEMILINKIIGIEYFVVIGGIQMMVIFQYNFQNLDKKILI
jgi:hypothetical protein